MSTGKVTMTDAQKRGARAIREYTDLCGYGPSIRDLAYILEFASTNAIADHLRRMEARGCVLRDARVARSLRLSPAGLEQLR